MADQSGPFKVERSKRGRCYKPSTGQPSGSISSDASSAEEEFYSEDQDNLEIVKLQAAAGGFGNSELSPPLAPVRRNRTRGDTSRVVSLFTGRKFKSKPVKQTKTEEENEDETSGLDSFNFPSRQYECSHYEVCLSLAAAFNWESFSCDNCSGCVNEKLVWRARHLLREDNTLRCICKLPSPL